MAFFALAVAMVLACAALLVVRVRVRARVKATASADGIWSAAAGGAVGPVAFTAGASAAGTKWTAHVLGRRLLSGTRVPSRARSARISPAQAVDTASALLRRVRVDRLDAFVEGAGDDPATSAQVLGLIAAASAAFAPRANVASRIDWLAESPFVDVDFDLEASFVPLLLGWDLARGAWMRRSP